MNANVDVKGTQGTERYREVEEKLKVLEQSGVDAGELKRHRLLRHFWKSAAGFWGKRGTRLSWILCGALLLIILLQPCHFIWHECLELA